MTTVYVKIGFDFKEVLAISNLQTTETDLSVVLDDDLVDFSRVNGYIVYIGDDGQNHLKFDESRYDEYIKELEKQEAIAKGEELKQQLAFEMILKNATDEQAYIMKYLYDEWNENSFEYKTGDRFRYNNDLYKVLRNHTSSSELLPNSSSSLYLKISY